MGQTDVVSEVETEIAVFISNSHRDGEVHLIEYFVKLVADTEFRLQSSLQREAMSGKCNLLLSISITYYLI